MSQLFETNSSLKCQPSLLPNPQGVMGRISDYNNARFKTVVSFPYFTEI